MHVLITMNRFFTWVKYTSMENQWLYCYNLHEVIWFSSIPVLKCYRFPIWHPEKFSLLSLIGTGCPKMFMSHSFIYRNTLDFIGLSKCNVFLWSVIDFTKHLITYHMLEYDLVDLFVLQLCLCLPNAYHGNDNIAQTYTSLPWRKWSSR